MTRAKTLRSNQQRSEGRQSVKHWQIISKQVRNPWCLSTLIKSTRFCWRGATLVPCCTTKVKKECNVKAQKHRCTVTLVLPKSAVVLLFEPLHLKNTLIPQAAKVPPSADLENKAIQRVTRKWQQFRLQLKWCEQVARKWPPTEAQKKH